MTLLGDEKHSEAIEYDLIALGLRLDWLGMPTLTWRDLLIVVKQARPGSAIHTVLGGDSARWGLGEHLLAAVFDQLRVLVWQQTKDGHEGTNPPQPLQRPGIDPPEIAQPESRSIEEIEAWLAKRNPSQHPSAA